MARPIAGLKWLGDCSGLIFFAGDSAGVRQGFVWRFGTKPLQVTHEQQDVASLDAVDDFISQDKERKRTAFDEFIQYLTKRREDLLTMTWVFNHSTELYRWVERLEAK